MITGERIRQLRKTRGITQKKLGISVGFSPKNADIRIAQYEKGTRVPRDELTEKLAAVLGVSPAFLQVPEIDNPVGVIHTLFALEDMYGLEINTSDGSVVLRVRNDFENTELRVALIEWLNKSLMLRSGEISREEYDDWRCNFTGAKKRRG